MIESILTGFLLGLGGSLHCVGMCGAIVTAFSLTTAKQSFTKATFTTLSYNIGRIMTYMLLGVFAGLVSQLGDYLGILTALRILAALLLIATGLYLLNWWKGILFLEKAGQSVWRRIQPMSQKLNPSRSLLQAVLSGMVWGLIPCGLVYSALAIASSQGGIPASVSFMLAFGAGTLGPVFLMGIGFTSVAQWLKKPRVKITLATLMIAMGGWSLYSLSSHGDHAQHQQSPEKHQHHHH